MQINWNAPPIRNAIARYSWGNSEVDYAADVHEGQRRFDGSRMPARPWTEAAIQETNLESVFLENYYVQRGDISAAFRKTAEDLGERFQDMIQDERWEWDRPTLRANGELVDSPRNIVDTGRLLESQELEFD